MISIDENYLRLVVSSRIQEQSAFEYSLSGESIFLANKTLYMCNANSTLAVWPYLNGQFNVELIYIQPLNSFWYFEIKSYIEFTSEI